MAPLQAIGLTQKLWAVDLGKAIAMALGGEGAATLHLMEDAHHEVELAKVRGAALGNPDEPLRY